MNRSPKKWFKEQQLESAREILLATGSVKIAAIETGFTQPANFSRDFKTHYGASASETLNAA